MPSSLEHGLIKGLWCGQHLTATPRYSSSRVGGQGVFPKMLAVLRGTHQQVKNWARRVKEAGLTAPGCGHPRNPNRESWAPQPHPHGAHALFRKRTLVWWVRNKSSTTLLRETAARPRGVGLGVGSACTHSWLWGPCRCTRPPWWHRPSLRKAAVLSSGQGHNTQAFSLWVTGEDEAEMKASQPAPD